MFDKLNQGSPQRTMEACSIILALIVTSWCVISNTDPKTDETVLPKQAFQTVERQLERAQQQEHVIRTIYAPIAAYYHRDSNGLPTMPSAETFAMIIDPEERTTMVNFWEIEAQVVASWQKLGDVCKADDWMIGKYASFYRRGFSFNPSDAEIANLLSKTCRAAIQEHVETFSGDDSEDLVEDAAFKAERLMERYETAVPKLEEARKTRRCSAFPDVCEREWQLTQIAADEKEKQIELAKENAVFDAAFNKAGEIEQIQLAAAEIVRRSMVGWAWVMGISILGILGLRFSATGDYLYLASPSGGTKAVLRIPLLPFARPWFERGQLDGWKLIVDFRGRTFLQDKDGARVRIDNCRSAYIDAVFHQKTASDYIVQSFETKANLDDATRRLDAMRRLLLLTVEGLRKSRDFYRSNHLYGIRQTILNRVTRDVEQHDPIHAELNLRQEEERLSEQINTGA